MTSCRLTDRPADFQPEKSSWATRITLFSQRASERPPDSPGIIALKIYSTKCVILSIEVWLSSTFRQFRSRWPKGVDCNHGKRLRIPLRWAVSKSDRGNDVVESNGPTNAAWTSRLDAGLLRVARRLPAKDRIEACCVPPTRSDRKSAEQAAHAPAAMFAKRNDRIRRSTEDSRCGSGSLEA